MEKTIEEAVWEILTAPGPVEPNKTAVDFVNAIERNHGAVIGE